MYILHINSLSHDLNLIFLIYETNEVIEVKSIMSGDPKSD